MLIPVRRTAEQYEGMGVLVKRPAVQGLYAVCGTKVFLIGKA
jgi:hypothetical protein